MDDAQFGFDLEFDPRTQAFLEWSAPKRMESQIRLFLTETVAGVADYDADAWWEPPLLAEILQAARDRFGDWEGFIAPDRRDPADQFVRFLGECCIRQHPGMTWTGGMAATDYPVYGIPFYTDFRPEVHYTDTRKGCNLIFPAEALFEHGPKQAEYEIRTAGQPS